MFFMGWVSKTLHPALLSNLRTQCGLPVKMFATPILRPRPCWSFTRVGKTDYIFHLHFKRNGTKLNGNKKSK